MIGTIFEGVDGNSMSAVLERRPIKTRHSPGGAFGIIRGDQCLGNPVHTLSVYLFLPIRPLGSRGITGGRFWETETPVPKTGHQLHSAM
jgi:hypothetical protein